MLHFVASLTNWLNNIPAFFVGLSILSNLCFFTLLLRSNILALSSSTRIEKLCDDCKAIYLKCKDQRWLETSIRLSGELTGIEESLQVHALINHALSGDNLVLAELSKYGKEATLRKTLFRYSNLAFPFGFESRLPQKILVHADCTDEGRAMAICNLKKLLSFAFGLRNLNMLNAPLTNRDHKRLEIFFKKYPLVGAPEPIQL